MNADFNREQRLVDLAVKLQHGDITPEEQLEAANALSYTAGARLGHEYKAGQLEKRLDFITRVLRAFWSEDSNEIMFWRVDDNQPSFYVMCSDTFAPASADVEEITPDNVHILEQSIEDVKVIGNGWADWGFMLFCARVRGMRIMPWLRLPEGLKEMFDACGPERTDGKPPSQPCKEETTDAVGEATG